MNIDIIIPCKNPDKKLLDTIRSIYQIEEICNIFIINDYSTRGLLYFKKASLYSKVIIEKNIYTKGISGALNTGIIYTKNNFIGRIDSGDLCLDKARFKKIIKIFLKNDLIDLVCSGMIGKYKKKINPNLIFANKVLSPFSKIPHPTWVIKKSSIKYLYRDNCTRFEDYVFLLDNKFNITQLEQNDIYYDTDENLNRIFEIKVAISKSLYFISYSKNKLINTPIALLYIVLRFIRLVITNKKVI